MTCMCCVLLSHSFQEEWRGEIEQLSWKPRAFLVKGFLSDEEADHIINIVSLTPVWGWGLHGGYGGGGEPEGANVEGNKCFPRCISRKGMHSVKQLRHKQHQQQRQQQQSRSDS